MFEKVLVPVDLSQQSQMMVGIVSRMGGYGVKEVIVYSVMNEDTSLREGVLARMDRKLRDTGMAHSLVTDKGDDPATSIVKAGEREGATMIVMAASGKGRVREFFVGSTSLAVIRQASTPVLIDKFPFSADADPESYCESCPGLLDRVLVALDLTRSSRHMVPRLQELIDAGAGSMTLFHVVQAKTYGKGDEKRLREARHRLEAFRQKLVAPDCNVDIHLHFGAVAYNILEASREVDATLMVLGTTGKGFLRGAALGSVSEEALKGSTRPVLLIPC